MAPALPPLRVKLRERVKRTHPQQSTNPDEAVKPFHWRQKMKARDPQRYEDIKARDALYSKIRSAAMTDEEKQRQRDRTRERVRLFRLRKKQREEANKATTKKSERNKLDKKKTAQRKKWAEEKQKQRAKWTLEKRAEINLKQRTRRRQEKEELQRFRRVRMEEERRMLEEEKKKLEEAKKKLQEDKKKLEEEKRQMDEEAARKKQAAETEQELSQQEIQLAQEQLTFKAGVQTPRSGEARRQALHRAKVKISPQPTIYADTVCDLITRATPRKRQALEEKGLRMSKADIDSLVTEKVSEALQANRHKRDKKTRGIRRGLASTLKELKLQARQVTAKGFSVTPKLLRKLQVQDKYRNPFSISKTTRKQVRSFFENQAVQLPNKKDISKKTLQKTAVLQRPITSLYADFRKAYPNIVLKKSSFFMLRPRHIRPMAKSKLRGCLCEYCTNLELKISVLNKVCSKFNTPQCSIKDTFHLSRITMCTKPIDQKYHDPDCTRRQCKRCGVKLLKAHLNPLIKNVGFDFLTQWSRWGLVKNETVSKMTLGSKEGTLKEFLDEMYEELEGFAAHLFTWQWQHKEYTRLIQNPPQNTVTAVLDFAENYACLIQDEVQAAHWAHEQATIHPIVCTYKCNCHQETVTHSLIYISDDKKHDYHAVDHFYHHCIGHLKMVHNLQIDRLIRFSDGCAAQYKSKGPFLDIVQCDTPTEHHYFGSRHGKGPSDGESAVVKQHASTAVRSGRTAILTPHALYTFVNETLRRGEVSSCVPFRREFFYVPSSAINRSRPAPTKAVKDTRKIHSIKKGKKPLHLLWRSLSCFCPACLTSEGAEGACVNRRYAGAWNSAVLDVPDITSILPSSSAAKASKTATSHLAPPGPITSLNDSTEDQVDKAVAEPSSEPASLKASFQDFVTVRVPVQGNRKSKSEEFFVAKVIAVEGEHLRLQYMKEQGEYFTWPGGEPQYFLHPRQDVVKIMHPPEPVLVGSRVFFKFN